MLLDQFVQILRHEHQQAWERFHSQKVAAVLGNCERLLQGRLNLIQWASEVRRRPAVVRQ